MAVVTNDKDLAQLVSPHVSWFDFAKQNWYGPAEVEDKFGVPPSALVDFQALCGDKVDDIPGVAGIGAKSAAALIRHFGRLVTLYERLDEVESLPVRGAKSMRKKLEAGREEAFLSQRLAAAVTDVDLPDDDLTYRGADRAALAAVCERLGFPGTARPRSAFRRLMRAFYSDVFVLPLPEGHRFPMSKYRRLRERVAGDGDVELAIPPAVTDDEIRRVHAAAYLDTVRAGRLTPLEQRRIGFPWSPQLVERSRRSAGATLAAARAALEDGVACNLAGGTHHAGPDWGQGYCVFNDASIALRTLQAEGRIERGVVLDCDVHQGNGTAAIHRDDPTVFTFSIHGEHNFPFRKEESDLDLALPDGAGRRRIPRPPRVGRMARAGAVPSRFCDLHRGRGSVRRRHAGEARPDARRITPARRTRVPCVLRGRRARRRGDGRRLRARRRRHRAYPPRHRAHGRLFAPSIRWGHGLAAGLRSRARTRR